MFDMLQRWRDDDTATVTALKLSTQSNMLTVAFQ